MQELSITLTTPAERLLHFIDFLGISKYEFHKKCGLSNGFLDKSKEMRSDKIRKIIDKYPILNVYWLLTGEGSMLREEEKKDGTGEELQALKRRIAELEERLHDKEELLKNYRKILLLVEDKINRMEEENNNKSKARKA